MCFVNRKPEMWTLFVLGIVNFGKRAVNGIRLVLFVAVDDSLATEQSPVVGGWSDCPNRRILNRNPESSFGVYSIFGLIRVLMLNAGSRL